MDGGSESGGRREVFRALANSRELVRLLLAYGGSMLGGWAWSVALAVWAFETGGAALVGLATVSRYIPMAVGALFAGAAVEHWGRRRVMVGSDASGFVLLVLAGFAIASDAPEAVVLVLVGANAFVHSVFRPAQAALVPTLAESPQQLTAANAVSGFVENAGMFIGPALGGVVLTLSSPEVVLFLSAATLIWSAVLVASIRVDDEPAPAAERESILAAPWNGLRTLGASRTTSVLAGLIAAQTIVAGALNVLVVVTALDLLQKGQGWVGYLNGAVGVGGLVGAAACVGLVGRPRLTGAFGFGMFLWGLPLLLIAAWTSPTIVVLAMLLIGVGNSVGDLASFTLLQRAVPASQLARLFGGLEAVMIGSMAAGAAVVSILIERAGATAGFVAAGVLLPALTVLLWRPLRAIDAAAIVPAEAIRALRAIPMFGLLPPTTLEQLALGARRHELAPGSVVFAQGDPGDRYYAIDGGAVDVKIDGSHVRTMGPGAGFGEIALLRDAPRTATVSVVEPAVLWSIERNDFLAAVTGHAGATARAEDVAAARLLHAAPQVAAAASPKPAGTGGIGRVVRRSARRRDHDAAVSGAAVPGRPSARRAPTPRTVLAVASLGVSVAFVDATIVNIAFPDIERSFDGTPISSLSWVLNAYNIVFAAFLVAAGRFADLLGRRRVFLLGLGIFTLASLLCALAPSVGTLVAARVLQAVGAALVVPSSLAIVLDAFPAERRSHGVALLSAVAAAAAGLGPSLGGLLVAAGDWRLVFYVNLPIGIAAIVLARRHLVESRAPGRRRLPDIPGALIFALAIAALVLGVVMGQDWGWDSPAIIGSFASAVVLGAVFAWRCGHHRSPILDLSLLRIRTFAVSNAMTILAAAGFYGYTLTNVLFLTGVWGYSVLSAGLALTPGPFVAAAVAGPTSRLVERVGHRPVLAAGGLIWGGAVFWLVTQVGPDPAFVSEWLPGIVLLGIGAGTLLPNISGAAVASVPGETFATATAVNSVARQVGAAIGVAVVVAIIGTPSPADLAEVFDDAWTYAAISLIAAGAGCLAIARRGPEADTERTPSLAAAARAVLREPAPAPARRSSSRAPRRREVVVPAAGNGAHGDSVADFLARVPLFASLEPSLLEAAAAHARVRRVAAGEWLFREGDRADAMYVVRAGRLDVLVDGAAVREIGRGDAVGELALLTESPRSASLRARRESELLAIERDDFLRLLETAPQLPLALTRTLAGLLRESRPAPQALRPLPATVTLLALDEGVPLRHIATRLTESLGHHTRVALLEAGTAPEPGNGTDPTSNYLSLLDRAEAENDLVVLSAGSPFAGSAWAEFCLQQGDRLVALATGGPLPETDRPELHGCDLVGIGVRLGSGRLKEWAARLDPVETHVLRPGGDMGGDLERMARRLTGRSVGVVLSGGGARAFSHIGVLEELLAAGVTIDRVAGVSMGAYVAAMFAMGMTGDEMDARAYEEWVRRRPLGDYTLPRHGLIRGERAEAMYHRTFGDVAIEELALSFFCGCADLRSGRFVVSRWGPVWEATALSACIPILVPPQVRGRELLIDGSLVDNLPVGTMADMGEGPVIAVDVKASFEPASHNGSTPERARAKQRPPSLGETLTRVLLLGSANTSEAARQYADLTVKPRNDGVGFLEFHQIDAARRSGRAAAREALEHAPAAIFG